MKIRTFLTAAAAAAIIGGVLPARACTFDPRDVQKDIDNAEIIFTGVSGVQRIANELYRSRPEYKTVFKVDKIFKGRVTPDAAVNIFQMHDAWANYIHFSAGKKYLVLAGSNAYGLAITGCSPVMALDPAAAGSDEPGPEYKYMLAAALGDATMFPMPKASGDGARQRLDQEDKEDSGKGGD